jgi:hypothetical protein
VAKAKDLLLGLPPTDAEVRAVTADPKALPGLIDSWMAQPQFEAKMLDFFKQAFQQTQTTSLDYDEQLGRSTNAWNRQESLRFVRAAEESFARTAWDIVTRGRPFTEVLTTQSFMLNTALMSSYAFMDALPFADSGASAIAQSWLVREVPTFRYVRQRDMAYPLSEIIDPQSPRFGMWFDAQPYPDNGPNDPCKRYPLTLDPAAVPMGAQRARVFGQAMVFLGDHLYGGRPGCGAMPSQFTDADWSTWRRVTVRRPRAGERHTLFYDLDTLRQRDELVLDTPRVGFFTTPAFFANWPTNASNLARVTANQALIVALGRSFDDTNATIQVSETARPDEQHVQEGTACYNCHKTLDPMRDFFRQSYSLSYHLQLDPALTGKTGTFALDGVSVAGKGVIDLAQAMAAHPRFAAAWTQKLCRFANSASCVEDDPEFVRVAEAFRQSDFSFKVLVRELLASPLTTFLGRTKTADELGVSLGIARREHLCAALGQRLGMADACALQAQIPTRPGPGMGMTSPLLQRRNLALAVPGAGYARGAEAPLLPHDPNLFFTSAVENLCGVFAAGLVDAGSPPRYTSARADEAMADFVATLMGVPASGDDPLHGELRSILKAHHQAVLASGQGASDALRSTFVLACSSPLSVSMGL